MRKYWVYFLENIYELLTYRVRLILLVASQFAAPLTMIWLFSGLTGGKFAGMSKDQLLSYYIFTSILFLFLSTTIDTYVGEAIINGQLANLLIKPIKFWIVALNRDLSSRIFKLIIGFPFFALLLYIYKVPVHFSMGSALLVGFTLLLSLLLVFATHLCLGFLAFWFEEIWGFQNLKDVSILLLGGVTLPYQFFPHWLQQVLSWLPFPYLINWPLRLGFSGSLLKEITVAIFWCVIFIVLNIYIWKRGLKDYSALGVY